MAWPIIDLIELTGMLYACAPKVIVGKSVAVRIDVVDFSRRQASTR
jgi:hypothetical protein